MPVKRTRRHRDPILSLIIIFYFYCILVSLESIKYVLASNQLSDDDRLKKYHKSCQFAVGYDRNGNETRLYLVAFSMDVARKWTLGLDALIKRKGLLLSKPDPLRDEWLQDAFMNHDTDRNGALSLAEIEKLLRTLNINIESKQLKSLFNEANSQGVQGHKDGTLTKEEFADFFKNISTREEIVKIVQQYAKNEKRLTANEFQQFLSKEQNMPNVTLDECEQLIRQYEPVDRLKETTQMGMDGLTAYLLSHDCDLFIPECDKVHQDMTQPLSHYFISSSHNTYLMEDQLTGPSSVDAYISALKKGCRCVELDCWDGDDNEPVIYHGHTFTSKILFKDAIAAINEYAFHITPYPLILSLENHCSVDQQVVMAKHLVNILGDKLYDDPVEEGRSSLPSPEALKFKILIKGKKLKPHQEKGIDETDEDDGGDVSEDDEAAEISETDVQNAALKLADNTDAEEKPKKEDKEKEKPIGKKLTLAKELSRLVNYVQSVKFVSFELYQNKKYYHMSSFGESKFTTLGESDAKSFVHHNKTYLSRTYPAGRRVDSSNYHPQDAWNIGCQIVALNFQTDGQMMDLYLGKFRDNGKSGYVLKPQCMTDGNEWATVAQAKKLKAERSLKEIRQRLEAGALGVLGARINNIEGNGILNVLAETYLDSGLIIDPYVQIEVHGIPMDSKEKAFSTKVIQNNGFNPFWNESFSFKLHMPEMAMLRFTVYDSDYGSDDFIGQFSIPVKCMRTGYRHMQLLSKSGQILPKATLFLHTSITEE